MAGGDSRPVGVSPNGEMPLPWLREPLLRALRLERSHALLLYAPQDAGQFDLALTLAQAWLCEHPGQAPCGRCSACRLVHQRSHPDLRIVVPEALRVRFEWLAEDDPLLRASAKPSREIKIEQVRDAIEWTQRSASSTRGRSLVIHPAEALNAHSASALLKTLEEPPGNLRIVMAGSDPQRLLPTLRSRVQRLRVEMPDAKQAKAWLSEQGVAVQTDRALAVCGGSPLATMMLLEAGFDDAALAALPSAVARGDAQGLLGKPVPLVVDLLQRVAHDAMARAAGAGARYFDDAALPAGATLSALAQWQRELLRVAAHDEHPWHAALLVEALVTNGARCWPRTATPARRGGDHSLHSAR